MLLLLPLRYPSAGERAARLKEDDVLAIDARAVRAADDTVPLMPDHKDMTSEELLMHILASLEDDKAEEIVQVDLRGKSTIADYMVICSGRSSRQVSAMSEKLVERLKQDHGRSARVEGKETGDWVLIDAGDVIVHVFRPEVRDFYQLEKMWLPAPVAAGRA